MVYKLLSSLLIIAGISLAENSLIAHWSFDSLRADTFYNSAGNNYHVSSPDIFRAKGVLGYALSLSENSFKPIVQNSEDSFLMSQFSVEAWVMINEDPAKMGREYDQYKILDYSSIGPSRVADGFSFCIMGGGRPDITLGQESWVDCTSPESLKINRWYHLVGTCDGKTLKLYINGRRVQQQSYSGTTIAPQANATIGCQIRETSEIFCRLNGLIDELKLYNYARDSIDIVEDYNELEPYTNPPYPRLLAHWSFDSLKADTFYNSVKNDYHVSSPNLQTAMGVWGNAFSLNDNSFKPVIKNSTNAFLLSQFSVEAWVMINETPEKMGREYYQYKILEYSSLDPSRFADGFSLCIMESGRPDVSLGQGDWVNCISPEALELNRWYHLVGTCDGQTLKLYINGKKVQQLAYSGITIAPEANATIGCQIRETSEVFCRFYGRIDELKLYNYAIDSLDVFDNYSKLDPYATQSYPRLVAHWSFDSSFNQTYFDVTKNGFDALACKGTTSITAGIAGNSLNCSEDSFLVRVKNSTSEFNVPQFTIEGWIYSYVDLVNPGSFFNAHTIFTTQTWIPSGNTSGFEISVDDNGYFHLAMANSTGNSWVFCTSDSVLKPRKWYHVAATYDKEVMKVYLNGRSAGSIPLTTGYAVSHSDAVIGCQMPADSSEWRNWFMGKIDELKFYNYALDEHSIASIYNRLKPEDDLSFEINLGMKTTYAQPADTVIMPIYITNFEDFNISACQFSMRYESDNVELLSIQKDSGIVSSWPLFAWKPVTTDSVSIAMAGTVAPLNYGEGELVRCVFRVKPSVINGDTCTIRLSNISIDETYHLVTATSKNGKIIFDNNSILYGDVTGNREVNIFDAQNVLSYVVGTLKLPDSICCPNFTLAVADVSGNGSITSYDAALIFQHSVGLLPEFPVSQQKQIRFLQKKSAGSYLAACLSTRIENNANNELRCTVIGSNLKGFVAGDFSIGFDPSIVPSRGTITTTVKGATLNSKIDVNNRVLKIAIVTNDKIDSNDPVPLLSIALPPAQRNTEAAFSIIDALINEGMIPNTISTAAVRPGNGTLISNFNNGLKVQIRGYNFTVNSTAIGITTEICVWALNGKKIINRSFVNHTAGTTLTFNHLPSGSYFYKVKSGSVISTGRFVITR